MKANVEKISNIKKFVFPILLSAGIASVSLPSTAAGFPNNQQEDSANVLTVLQTDLKFSNPKGYCPVDKNSSTYRGYKRSFEQSTKNNMRLIYAAVPCNQVEDFNKGTVTWETFDKFVTVSVVRMGPDFTKLDIPKEQFISAVSSAGKEDPNYLFNTSNALYLLMEKPNMHVVSAFTYAKGVPLNI
ncbi:MAG: hypothetical protein ACFWTZ_08235 [Burkholderia sp.]|jgi:hypothetical protein